MPVVFHLLQVSDKDIRNEALEDRRRAERIAKGQRSDAILFSEAIAAEGELLFKRACEMGLEGIVPKRVGGAYWSSRCRN